MKIPQFRYHAPTKCFYAFHGGKRVYFGRNELAGRKQYQEWLSKLIEADSAPMAPEGVSPLVAELVAVYLKEAAPKLDERDQRRAHFALSTLSEKFGHVEASAFRVREIEAMAEHFGNIRKTVRKTMERTGPPLSMRYVRKLMGCIRACWNWLALRDLVTAESAAKVALAVARGKTYGGINPPAVRPVRSDHCAAVLAECKPRIAAMAKIQLLTGMRTGELISMSADQIDRGTLPWVYRPVKHKNAWRGKDRAIYISEEAAKILMPYLDGPCFKIGPDAYVDSLKRAAERAKVPPFRPYQLRHTAATEAKLAHGDDFAQRILDHAGKGLLDRYTHTAEEERRRRAG